MTQKRLSKIIFTFFIALLPLTAMAVTWQDLWWRSDEQGKKLLDQGRAKQAAERFERVDWKGIAYYRSGQYLKAITEFSKSNTPLAHYNRGNAFAHLGEYQEAINAYQQTLKQEPNNADAKYNYELLKKLLKQKKKKQQSMNSQQQAKQNQKKQVNNKKQQAQNRKQEKQPAKEKQTKLTASKMSAQQKEEKQALKQWLKQIPDNPGGLLRQKFLRDHLRMQQQREY